MRANLDAQNKMERKSSDNLIEDEQNNNDLHNNFNNINATGKFIYNTNNW